MRTATAAQLARLLEVSRGRITQMVSEGRFEGCFTGEGPSRRFDLGKCAAAIERSIEELPEVRSLRAKARKLAEASAAAHSPSRIEEEAAQAAAERKGSGHG